MVNDMVNDMVNETASDDIPTVRRRPDDRSARGERRTAYLRAAAQLVLREGFDGLTMGALAKEVGAAIGTTYGYFESKDEILAELQLVSMDVLGAAVVEARMRWSKTLAGDAADDAAGSAGAMGDTAAAIADVLFFTEFFIQAPDAYPEEFRLQQMQLASPDNRYEPAQLEALAEAGQQLVAPPMEAIMRLAGAEERFRGNSLSRTTELTLGLNGVALVRNLKSAEEFFDVPDISRRLTADLLVGWGATRDEVREVRNAVRPIVEAMPLSAFESHRSNRLANLGDHAV